MCGNTLPSPRVCMARSLPVPCLSSSVGGAVQALYGHLILTHVEPEWEMLVIPLGSGRCLSPSLHLPKASWIPALSVLLASHSVFCPTSFPLQQLKHQRSKAGSAEHHPHPRAPFRSLSIPPHPPAPFSKPVSQGYLQACPAYGSAQVFSS